jgi:outer membrane protein TolC
MAVRLCGVLVRLGAAVALLLGAGRGLNAAEGEREASPAEKKLQERVEVLEQIVKLEAAAFQAARTTFLSVLTARRELLQAKLELTKDSKRRIELLQTQVELAGQLEESAQRVAGAAELRTVDVLRAKAHRLKAEAELAEEQARANAAKK